MHTGPAIVAQAPWSRTVGTLFAAFGSNDPVFDLDGDGSVTSLDFSIMLAAWGSCPQE
jgi:hypothetical protein